MVTYDFKCNACGSEVEIRVNMGDESAPACGCGGTMSKVFSAPGIIFRGNGWGGKS